uniref:chemotaxis protein n=1 Tax=Hylemonella sp. TaxID=2066020 RepID=UPI0035AED4F3
MNSLKTANAPHAAASSNRFELLLFRLGETAGTGQRELFGINIFKVREIMVMPTITSMVNAPSHVLGVANIRGQIINVIDLPAIAGCTPRKDGERILLVTEFARTTQGFAVEEVTEIVQVDWKHVLSADGHGGELVTSIARVDGDAEDSRLAQVLDVERILADILPEGANLQHTSGGRLSLPAGTVVLAADDSAMARGIIEKGLQAMGVPYIMTKSGKEAWERLQALAAQARAEGKSLKDKVALLLTDLEMPEMDGFTLTRQIKADAQTSSIPVVVHSSLTGTASELQAQSAGADAYIAKFHIDELADKMREVLAGR